MNNEIIKGHVNALNNIFKLTKFDVEEQIEELPYKETNIRYVLKNKRQSGKEV
jgi:hypothetical protein